jgi:hypothetical protein
VPEELLVAHVAHSLRLLNVTIAIDLKLNIKIDGGEK